MLLFKSFKSDIIQEAVKLTPAQLDKPNSITGEDRLDILKRLIQDNKPLELVKGGTFLVTEIDDALAQIEIFKKLKNVEKKEKQIISKSGTNNNFFIVIKF